MSSYSDFVGYVPDRLRLQVSGTVTGEGIVAENSLGLPNNYFVSTAQGVATTTRGVSNPGLCFNSLNNTFNLESGVTFISFQNVVAANGNLTITGEAGGVNCSVAFPKFEYTAGSITGKSPRLTGYSFPSLKASEANIFFSGSAAQQLDFSNLTRARGIFIEYGTGGVINGLDTLSKFVACIPPANITGISGAFNSTPFTGSVKITGDLFSFSEYAITIGPSGQPNAITATGTVTGDFLSSLKQGSVYYYPPNNITDIAIAQNYLNPVPSTAPAVFQYTATTGITGITFPPVSGSAYFSVLLNSGSTTGTPLNINALATGHSGTLLGFNFDRKGNGRRVNITISGYSACTGNADAAGPITASNTSGGLTINNSSTSGIFISGHNLTRFFSLVNNNAGARYSAFFTSVNGPFTYTATGTELIYGSGASGSLGFYAQMNTGSTGTFNFTNATYVSGIDNTNGSFTFKANNNPSRIILNLPEATKLYSTITGWAATNNTAFILDAPKLASGVGVVSDICLRAQGTTAFATGILSHPAAGNGSPFISGVAILGGKISVSTTGGTPVTSGTLIGATFDTTGNCNINYDFGGTQIINSLIIIARSGATNVITGTATGAIRVTGITATITGGTCTHLGADISTGGSQTLVVNNATGTFDFTAGTQQSGILTTNVGLNSSSGAILTVNEGSLRRIGGTVTISGDTAGTVGLTATGLNVVTGNATVNGFGLGNVFYTGGQISGYNGFLRINGNTTGTVNYDCTNGTPFATGYISGGFLASGAGGSTITTNLGGVLRSSCVALVTSTGDASVSVTATGLSVITGVSTLALGTGNVVFSTLGGTIFYTGGQISGMDGGLTGIARENGPADVNFAFTGGTPFADSSIPSGIYIFASGATQTATITGDLGGVFSSSGIVINASGSTATASLTTTGLNSLTGRVTLTAINGGTTFYTGGQISGISGLVSGQATAGMVNFEFTGGAPFAGSSIVSGIFITATGAAAAITGNMGGVVSTSRVVMTGNGNTATGSLTATGLTDLSSDVTLLALTGSTLLLTGGIQNANPIALTAQASGSTINCIFTGVAATGVVSNIFVTGTAADTTITGTFNNTSTIQTGVRILSSGRAIVTATGVTIISGLFPNSLVISGYTTSSVVSGIFPGLQTISDNLVVTVSGSGGVSFSDLQVVSGAYIVSGGTSAGQVDHGLNGVNSLTGIGVIQSKTQTIYLGGSNNVIGGISATGLTQIGNSGTIFNLVSGVVTSSGITNMDLRSLTGWYGRINVELAGATGLNLTSLQYIGSNSATGFAASQMNTPALQFILGTGITGDVTLTGLQYMYHRDQHNAVTQGTATGFLLIASGATSISMPNIVTGFLRQISGNTTKTGWIQGASVTGLSFGSSGTTQELFMNFTASGCPLNQTSVDNILETFASLDGTNGTTVYSGLTIRLNGLCSAPSSTGSGFRTTLTGAGRLNTVLVN